MKAVDFFCVRFSVVVNPLELLIDFTLKDSSICVQVTQALLKLIILS